MSEWFYKKYDNKKLENKIVEFFNCLQEEEHGWNYNYFKVMALNGMIEEYKSRQDSKPIGSQYSIFEL